ncbi:MAG: hypothetical protein HY764_01700 [Candidatus Portnoybacteria bacterium]|nr:hypothetical protein [Candidatus Portnoybacteria bacterium]
MPSFGLETAEEKIDRVCQLQKALKTEGANKKEVLEELSETAYSSHHAFGCAVCAGGMCTCGVRLARVICEAENGI